MACLVHQPWFHPVRGRLTLASWTTVRLDVSCLRGILLSCSWCAKNDITQHVSHGRQGTCACAPEHYSPTCGGPVRGVERLSASVLTVENRQNSQNGDWNDRNLVIFSTHLSRLCSPKKYLTMFGVVASWCAINFACVTFSPCFAVV